MLHLDEDAFASQIHAYHANDSPPKGDDEAVVVVAAVATAPETVLAETAHLVAPAPQFGALPRVEVAGATLVPLNPFFTSPGTTPTLNDGREVVTIPTQGQYQPLLDELGLKFKIRINLANGSSVSNLQPVAQDYSNNLFTIQ